jgi:hypothetical protein
MKKIVVRGLLVVLAAAAVLLVSLTVVGTEVVVTAQGCGTFHPALALPIVWKASANGGTARVPPLKVDVLAAPQGGQEAITVTGPLGIKASFSIAPNVQVVLFDGAALYRRSPLLRGYLTEDLRNVPQHQLLLLCQ